MIAALIIVFREVFEAGLIIGIVLAVTRTVPHRNQWIGGGVLAGVLAACVVAVFAGALVEPVRRHGAGTVQRRDPDRRRRDADLAQCLDGAPRQRTRRRIAGGGKAVVEGSKSLLALAVVVGVAVLREGSEVVLFLYGVLAGGNDSGLSVALGGLVGLVLGALVCMLTYFGLVKIPTRALFATTTILIALLAAGMAAQAAAFLEKANWLTALDNVVWDSGWLLSDSSILGKALHTLIGYTDQPTAMQLVGLSGDPGRDLRADAALRSAGEGRATGAGLKPVFTFSL